jgi:hypothetical protein
MHHYRLHQDPRSSHQQITRIVRELRRSPCSMSAPRREFSAEPGGKRIEIDGIEPNPAWAEAARPHYRSVFVSPIECVSTLPPRTYAVVVCGDVLEHVVDPVCGAAKAAGSRDGRCDIRHLAAERRAPRGAYDAALRLLPRACSAASSTRRTCTSYAKDGHPDARGVGLRVERASATPVPLDELWRSGEGTILFRVMMRVQYVFVHCCHGCSDTVDLRRTASPGQEKLRAFMSEPRASLWLRASLLAVSVASLGTRFRSATGSPAARDAVADPVTVHCVIGTLAPVPRLGRASQPASLWP